MLLKKRFQMLQRALAMFLLLALCLPGLIACDQWNSDFGGSGDQTTEDDITTTTSPETETGSLEDVIPEFTPDPAKPEPPENPEISLNEQSSKTLNGSFIGCQTITLLAEYTVGLDFDTYATKDTKTKCYYLHLPCRVDPARVTYSVTHKDGSVSGPYTVNLADDKITENECVIGNNNSYVIKAVKSDLPTVMVQVDEQYVTVADMIGDSEHETFAYGDMVTTVSDEMAKANGWATRYVSEDVDPDKYCSLDIRGRGNTTWKRAKKPFQIRTENDVDLLGMGYATTYALMANDQDGIGIRFPLALDLAAEMGIDYTSEHRQVDFYLNGVYKGMYSLVEKVEVAPNRVAIDEETDVLYEVDQYYKDSGNLGISLTQYDGQCRFRIHSPTEDATAENSKAILFMAIDALFSGNEELFLHYFDVDSWAKMYLLEQISMNNDAYHGSMYFYYSAADGKMHACAPWDFDWAFGGSHRPDPINWDPNLCDDAHRGISGPMFQYPTYVNRVLELYYEEGIKDLFETIPDKVEEYREKNRLGFIANDIVVDVYYYPSASAYPNNYPSTYDGLTDHLRDVTKQRLIWMEGKMDDLENILEDLENKE